MTAAQGRNPRVGDPETTTHVTPAQRRVRRYRRDSVGNNLDAVLWWCATHQEPVWRYDDDSFSCPYDLVTEAQHEHELVRGLWEVAR